MTARVKDPRAHDTSQGGHTEVPREAREAAVGRLLALRDAISRDQMFADATEIIRRHREARADDLFDYKVGTSP